MRKKRRDSIMAEGPHIGFDVLRATIEELRRIKAQLKEERPNNSTRRELVDMLLESSEASLAEEVAEGEMHEEVSRCSREGEPEESDVDLLAAANVETKDVLVFQDCDPLTGSDDKGDNTGHEDDSPAGEDEDARSYREVFKLLRAPRLSVGLHNPELSGLENQFKRTFENFESCGNGELNKAEFQDFLLAYCACAVFPDFKEHVALERAGKFARASRHQERVDEIWKIAVGKEGRLTFPDFLDFFNRAPMAKKDIEALRACITYWEGRRPARNEKDNLIARSLTQEEQREREQKLAKAEKDKVTRHLTCTEVLTSERKFVKKLQVMMDVFYKPMAEKKMRMRSVIFGNLPILLKLNTKFLTDVQTKMNNWNEDRTTLGDVFADYAPFFKIYAFYACNLPLATKFLSSTDDFAWANFRSFAEKQPRMKDALSSYLIEPVQRLPRYNLFLVSLQKLTDAYHPDSALLPRAHKQMVDVASYVNETVRLQEQTLEVWNLERRFAVYPYLQNPSRSFIRQARLTKKIGKIEVTYVFILFSNMLAIAEERPSPDGKGVGFDLVLRSKLPLDSSMTLHDSTEISFRVTHIKETAILLKRQGAHQIANEGGHDLVRAPTAVSFHRMATDSKSERESSSRSSLRNESFSSISSSHHPLRQSESLVAFNTSTPCLASRSLVHAESSFISSSSVSSASSSTTSPGSSSSHLAGRHSRNNSIVFVDGVFKCTRPHLTPVPSFSFEVKCENKAEKDIWVADLRRCLQQNQAAIPAYCCDKFDVRSDYYDIGDDTVLDAMSPDTSKSKRGFTGWLGNLHERPSGKSALSPQVKLERAVSKPQRRSWSEASYAQLSTARSPMESQQSLHPRNSLPNGVPSPLEQLRTLYSEEGSGVTSPKLQREPVEFSACEFCSATMQMESGKALCHCESCTLDMCYSCRVMNKIETPPFLKTAGSLTEGYESLSPRSLSRSSSRGEHTSAASLLPPPPLPTSVPAPPLPSSSVNVHSYSPFPVPSYAGENISYSPSCLIASSSSSNTAVSSSPSSLVTVQKCLRKFTRLFPSSNQHGVRVSDATAAVDLQYVSFPLKGIAENWLFRVNDYLRTQVRKRVDPHATRVIAALHAALCCLKNIYCMDVFSWSSVRSSLPIEVGLIKATSDCGNSSVSMGLASIYFRDVANHDNHAVAFLACTTFGVRFQLYIKTGGVVSCLLEYNPPATSEGGLGCTSNLRVGKYEPEVVHKLDSVRAEIKMGGVSAPWMLSDVRNRLAKMFHLKSAASLHVPVFAYVTGKIRNYWETCSDVEEKTLIESTISKVLDGMSEFSYILGTTGFMMPLQIEGQMDLEATRTMYRQYSSVTGKRLEPVISLSIGSDSCQWTSITPSAPDDYRRFNMGPPIRFGMNDAHLSHLSSHVVRYWQDKAETLATLMISAIERGNVPVIALKAGALANLEDTSKDLDKKSRKELCELAAVVHGKHEARRAVLIRRKSSSTKRDWTLWTKSASVACAEVSKVLSDADEFPRADFLRVQIENAPTFLKDLTAVAEGTVLVFWTADDLLAELLGPTRKRVISWIREVDLRRENLAYDLVSPVNASSSLPSSSASVSSSAASSAFSSSPPAAATVVADSSLSPEKKVRSGWLPSMTGAGTWPGETPKAVSRGLSMSSLIARKNKFAESSPLMEAKTAVSPPPILSPLKTTSRSPPSLLPLLSPEFSVPVVHTPYQVQRDSQMPQSLQISLEPEALASPTPSDTNLQSPGVKKPNLSLEHLSSDFSPSQIKVISSVQSIPETPFLPKQLHPRDPPLLVPSQDNPPPSSSPRQSRTLERETKSKRQSKSLPSRDTLHARSAEPPASLIDLFPEVVYVRLFPEGMQPSASAGLSPSVGPKTPTSYASIPSISVPSISVPSTPVSSSRSTSFVPPPHPPPRVPASASHARGGVVGANMSPTFSSTNSHPRSSPNLASSSTLRSPVPLPTLPALTPTVQVVISPTKTPRSVLSPRIQMPIASSPQARAHLEHRQRKEQKLLRQQEALTQKHGQTLHPTSHQQLQPQPQKSSQSSRNQQRGKSHSPTGGRRQHHSAFTFAPPPTPPAVPPKRKKPASATTPSTPFPSTPYLTSPALSLAVSSPSPSASTEILVLSSRNSPEFRPHLASAPIPTLTMPNLSASSSVTSTSTSTSTASPSTSTIVSPSLIVTSPESNSIVSTSSFTFIATSATQETPSASKQRTTDISETPAVMHFSSYPDTSPSSLHTQTQADSSLSVEGKSARNSAKLDIIQTANDLLSSTSSAGLVSKSINTTLSVTSATTTNTAPLATSTPNKSVSSSAVVSTPSNITTAATTTTIKTVYVDSPLSPLADISKPVFTAPISSTILARLARSQSKGQTPTAFRAPTQFFSPVSAQQQQQVSSASPASSTSSLDTAASATTASLTRTSTVSSTISPSKHSSALALASQTITSPTPTSALTKAVSTTTAAQSSTVSTTAQSVTPCSSSSSSSSSSSAVSNSTSTTSIVSTTSTSSSSSPLKTSALSTSQIFNNSPMSSSVAGMFTRPGYLHFPSSQPLLVKKESATPSVLSHSPKSHSPKQVSLLSFPIKESPKVVVHESPAAATTASVPHEVVKQTPPVQSQLISPSSTKSEGSCSGSESRKAHKSPGRSLRDRSSPGAARYGEPTDTSPEHSIFNLLRNLSSESTNSRSPKPRSCTRTESLSEYDEGLPRSSVGTSRHSETSSSSSSSFASSSGRERSSSHNCGSSHSFRCSGCGGGLGLSQLKEASNNDLKASSQNESLETKNENSSSSSVSTSSATPSDSITRTSTEPSRISIFAPTSNIASPTAPNSTSTTPLPRITSPVKSTSSSGGGSGSGSCGIHRSKSKSRLNNQSSPSKTTGNSNSLLNRFNAVEGNPSSNNQDQNSTAPTSTSIDEKNGTDFNSVLVPVRGSTTLSESAHSTENSALRNLGAFRAPSPKRPPPPLPVRADDVVPNSQPMSAASSQRATLKRTLSRQVLNAPQIPPES